MEEFAAGQLVIGVQRSCSADQYLESDYFGPEMYSELISDGSIKLYDTFPQSMVALEQGLVDAVIFDDVNIHSYIRDKPTLMMLETIATGEEYGVAMRDEDVELHEIINAGIADLMASDKWDELLLKYVIVEDVADEDVVDEDVADEDIVDENVVDEDVVDEDVEE
jgi:polar amino acid transport system substrate-binding protein